MKKAIIYTRTGDTGTTSLVGGIRTKKHSERLEAYGTLDELNSHLGMLIAHPDIRPDDKQFLTKVQNRIFDIGSYLACDPQGDFILPCGVTPENLEDMERRIDTLDAALPRIDRFVLPGGTMLSAMCQVARTVCRRAERRITALNEEAPVDPAVMAYVNRLSDYLFVLARFNNIITDHPEIFWQKNC